MRYIILFICLSTLTAYGQDSLLMRVQQLETQQRFVQDNLDKAGTNLAAGGGALIGAIVCSAIGTGLLFINAPAVKYVSYSLFSVSLGLTITSTGLFISSGHKMRSYTVKY